MARLRGHSTAWTLFMGITYSIAFICFGISWHENILTALGVFLAGTAVVQIWLLIHQKAGNR